jgi:phosphoglycolate phosphatase
MHSIVLFDFDGTLLDTSEGIFATANKTMVRLGFEPVDEVSLRRFVGPPLATCFKVACGLEEEYIEEACHIYREIYDKQGAKFRAKVYDGIVELLENLKGQGVVMAVATLKYEVLAIDVLDHFKLLPFFETVVGADYGGELTKAGIIAKAMRRLGEDDHSKALMVGDTQVDLEGSLESKLKFVGVDWGFGFTKGASLEREGHVLGMIEAPHHLLPLL